MTCSCMLLRTLSCKEAPAASPLPCNIQSSFQQPESALVVQKPDQAAGDYAQVAGPAVAGQCTHAVLTAKRQLLLECICTCTWRMPKSALATSGWLFRAACTRGLQPCRQSNPFVTTQHAHQSCTMLQALDQCSHLVILSSDVSASHQHHFDIFCLALSAGLH